MLEERSVLVQEPVRFWALCILPSFGSLRNMKCAYLADNTQS